MGRNPYEPIRENSMNPGHFREYTLRELVAFGEEAGLTTVRHWRHNYFLSGSKKNRLLVRAEAAVPRSLRQGLTIEMSLTGRDSAADT
jgi:hypothetical protein